MPRGSKDVLSSDTHIFSSHLFLAMQPGDIQHSILLHSFTLRRAATARWETNRCASLGESYIVKDGLYSGTSHVDTWCVHQTLCCVPRCVLLFLNPSRVLSVTKEAKVPRQRKQLRKVQRDGSWILKRTEAGIKKGKIGM